MIKIGNDSYEVPTPKGWSSFGLSQRIVPIAANVIGALGEVVGKTAGDLSKAMDMDVAKLLETVPRIGQIFSEMPPGELEALSKLLLADAVCIEGARRLPLAEVFDFKFQGRFIEALTLVWHAVQVWYPDVFSRARTFLAASPPGENSEASTTLAPSGPAGA